MILHPVDTPLPDRENLPRPIGALRPARSPRRRGASGCWLFIAMIVLGALAALALVVRRISVMESKSDLAESTWSELHTTLGRRLDLLLEIAKTPAGKRASQGKGAQGIARARTIVRKNDLPEIPRPALQVELDNYLQAQDMVSQFQAIFLEEVDSAAGETPSPELQDLLDQFALVEIRTNLAHRDFYDAVNAYNSAIVALPDVFLAKLVNLNRTPEPARRLFVIDENAEAEASGRAAEAFLQLLEGEDG